MFDERNFQNWYHIWTKFSLHIKHHQKWGHFIEKESFILHIIFACTLWAILDSRCYRPDILFSVVHCLRLAAGSNQALVLCCYVILGCWMLRFRRNKLFLLFLVIFFSQQNYKVICRKMVFDIVCLFQRSAGWQNTRKN